MGFQSSYKIAIHLYIYIETVVAKFQIAEFISWFIMKIPAKKHFMIATTGGK